MVRTHFKLLSSSRLVARFARAPLLRVTLDIASWDRPGFSMSSVSVDSRYPPPGLKMYNSTCVPTSPIPGMEAGTSGLRKPVKTYQQENYTENFVQSILSYATSKEELLKRPFVVGGDGRYYCKEATQIIIKMVAASGIPCLYVGQNGILSTPAASHLIRKHNAGGGIILTASHNPGGPDKDFGIKFNTDTGGPAATNITNHIYLTSTKLTCYNIVPDLECPVDEVCSRSYKIDGRDFTVNIVDSVHDYLCLMKEIFDFPKISQLLTGDKEKKPFKILLDCMHGVTGPYAKRIFIDELKACDDSVINAVPLVDFGGGHPDPNLVYAKDLVHRLEKGEHDFGAAFDGDGDRNMILGKLAFFVTPSDSLAVLADHLHCIPYFQKNGIFGVGRSMPTAAAVDRVAEKLKLPLFETPTGWKFFCNLLEHGKISICGEESFGTGSSHIREKDGIWAVLAWLSVIQHLNKSVPDILQEFWMTYGRNFTLRYDYENVTSESADKMMEHLENLISQPKFPKTKLGEKPNVYEVKYADNFEYVDPFDRSPSSKQGIRIIFTDGSRIIYRLSGTGSTGATIRIYFELYESDTGKMNHRREVVMEFLVQIALNLSKIKEFTQRDSPTVIT